MEALAMSEEVYTVEQFAERLKVHPKTVLRFIKEGRVRAVKVGRAYRILRSDLEAFGVVLPRAGGARATAIVDIPNVGPERAQQIARTLSTTRMGAEAAGEPMSINVAHDPVAKQVKVILVGAPLDVAALLRVVDVLLEQGR
jgi:excisionase family DNA binding protein